MINCVVVESSGARSGEAGSDRSLDLPVTDFAKDAALHDVSVSRKDERSHSGHGENGEKHVVVICRLVDGFHVYNASCGRNHVRNVRYVHT